MLKGKIALIKGEGSLEEFTISGSMIEIASEICAFPKVLLDAVAKNLDPEEAEIFRFAVGLGLMEAGNAFLHDGEKDKEED